MKGLFGKYKVILAPMAGITDVVFRQLCKEHGADLTFTEMVSAKGLSHANEKTRHLIDLADSEDEVAVQLFGHESDILAREAYWIQDHLKDRLALIDVNMGCPARKIVKKGDGAALMRDVRLASDIIASLRRAVTVPVTAKFRRGYFEGEETAVDFAKALEQSGAYAITVHGRYATQMYRGASSLDCIARVKEAVSIPVVGNGDIKCGNDACKMLERTSCDAIMIARATLGNPWIFEQVKRSINESGNVEKDDIDSSQNRLSMMERHARMLDGADGLNMKKMRKIAPYYIKGIPGAAKAREELSHCTTLSEFECVISKMRERI